MQVDRQVDRQVYRQAGRQADSQTVRQSDRDQIDSLNLKSSSHLAIQPVSGVCMKT